jgi:hypothetical protein
VRAWALPGYCCLLCLRRQILLLDETKFPFYTADLVTAAKVSVASLSHGPVL